MENSNGCEMLANLIILIIAIVLLFIFAVAVAMVLIQPIIFIYNIILGCEHWAFDSWRDAESCWSPHRRDVE